MHWYLRYSPVPRHLDHVRHKHECSSFERTGGKQYAKRSLSSKLGMSAACGHRLMGPKRPMRPSACSPTLSLLAAGLNIRELRPPDSDLSLRNLKVSARCLGAAAPGSHAGPLSSSQPPPMTPQGLPHTTCGSIGSVVPVPSAHIGTPCAASPPQSGALLPRASLARTPMTPSLWRILKQPSGVLIGTHPGCDGMALDLLTHAGEAFHRHLVHLYNW